MYENVINMKNICFLMVAIDRWNDNTKKLEKKLLSDTTIYVVCVEIDEQQKNVK